MSLALHRPTVVEVLEVFEETPSIFTLELKILDEAVRDSYRHKPGQFNMLYRPGLPEVAISVVDQNSETGTIQHTIRNVGQTTSNLSQLNKGDQLGLRGPFGRGWPLLDIHGRDVVVVTGGLGCAPVVSMIRYLLQRRDYFGYLTIIQGVKHADDLIWKQQYEQWQALPDTQVILAADYSEVGWPFHTGRVTELFDQIEGEAGKSLVMMCGPEPMMQASAEGLLNRGFNAPDIYLSMERNMQCAIGQCGHCQFGSHFVCKDGPVFPYVEIAHLLGREGV